MTDNRERHKGDDDHFPASESGTGMIDEDRGEPAETSLPESEANDPELRKEQGGPTQSWPGNGSPGTIPPPG